MLSLQFEKQINNKKLKYGQQHLGCKMNSSQRNSVIVKLLKNEAFLYFSVIQFFFCTYIEHVNQANKQITIKNKQANEQN